MGSGCAVFENESAVVQSSIQSSASLLEARGSRRIAGSYA
jgi:hypothetical protein